MTRDELIAQLRSAHRRAQSVAFDTGTPRPTCLLVSAGFYRLLGGDTTDEKPLAFHSLRVVMVPWMSGFLFTPDAVGFEQPVAVV